MGQLSNIPLSRYVRILAALGLTLDHISGGHQVWTKKGLYRDVIVQTHISPVPEMIVYNNLRTIGISKKEFIEVLKTIK